MEYQNLSLYQSTYLLSVSFDLSVNDFSTNKYESCRWAVYLYMVPAVDTDSSLKPGYYNKNSNGFPSKQWFHFSSYVIDSMMGKSMMFIFSFYVVVEFLLPTNSSNHG